jgi:hypothetical protein
VTPLLVDYLVARVGLPTGSGLAYDYVVGGDGVFIVAANPLLELRVPVAVCDIRSLAPVFAGCTLLHGPIPGSIWNNALRFLRAAHIRGSEILVGVRHDGDGYRLVVPSQMVAPLAVKYKPQPGWLLEMHSYRDASARFSATDCADEQGLRLYGVVGRLDDWRSRTRSGQGASRVRIGRHDPRRRRPRNSSGNQMLAGSTRTPFGRCSSLPVSARVLPDESGRADSASGRPRCSHWSREDSP